ncbi:MAG: tRNA (adenosine(37)-N6)-threonylcarbamoyltransferase complex ATPase subunit type 1 TsaE [Bacillota bacterium]
MRSTSPETTLQIGADIGRLSDPGQIILLTGDLGSGKTVLVKGIAWGLNIEMEITSPTYNLINEYPGECPLYHMDLYRLDDSQQLYDLGFMDYLDRSGVIAIEWPEIAFEFLPPEFLFIRIEILEDEQRSLEFRAEGRQSNLLMERLADNENTGD